MRHAIPTNVMTYLFRLSLVQLIKVNTYFFSLKKDWFHKLLLTQ